MAQDADEGGAEGFYTRLEDGFHGPFTREDLEAQLIVGSLRSEDLVQREGEAIWQPLRVVLQRTKPPVPGKVSSGVDKLPGWPFILATLGQRLQRDLEDPSAGVLLAFLAIGAAGMLASRLGWLLWLPWFGFVLIGATMMFLTRRRVVALPLGLCALAVPFLLLPGARAPKVEPVDQPFTVGPAATPPPLPEAPEAIAGLPSADAPPAKPASAATPAPVANPPPAVAEATAASPALAASVTATPTPALPTLSSAETIPPVPPPAGEISPAVRKIYQERSGALVIVKGEQGSGSGFIGNLGGKPYLFTNIHVAAGIKSPVFTLLDGTRLSPITAEAATRHDIMRFALKDPPRAVIDIASGLEQKVALADDVLVLGNSGGGGVVTSLPGKVLGIGPDRIEVSAEFIPGNSGSPIIHVPTGQVLGIATYLTRRHDEFASSGGTREGSMIVRRYGYRFDSVTNWEPINWLELQAENEQIERISQLTEDIFNFLDALEHKKTPEFATEALRRPATTWRTTISRRGLSLNDRRNATQTFLNDLRFLVRSDVIAADRTLRYSYFREKLGKEREVRDQLYKSFDTELARMTAPSL